MISIPLHCHPMASPLLGLWLFMLNVAAHATPALNNLLEQKLRLVEAMIATSQQRLAGQGESSPAHSLLETGRQQAAQARGLIAAGEPQRAAAILDQVLKTLARSAGLPLRRSDEALREEIAALSEQTESYRASLADLLRKAEASAEVAQANQQLQAAISVAQGLAQAGRLEEAKRNWATAYQLAVAAIGRFRAGETVVLSLNFASPAEEYAYEERRFQSHATLVRLNLADRDPEPAQRAMIESMDLEARNKRQLAANEATLGRHRDAVTLMEEANGRLVRALQALGLAVF